MERRNHLQTNVLTIENDNFLHPITAHIWFGCGLTHICQRSPYGHIIPLSNIRYARTLAEICLTFTYPIIFNMIRKIVSPIIYIAFLVPLFLGIILIVATVENTIGFLFDMNGFVELPILILILGTILFWIANKLMVGLEKLLKPENIDHFRQSSFYYLGLLYAFISLLRSGYHGGLGEAYILLVVAISAWAIIINAIFLYRRRKTNIS